MRLIQSTLSHNSAQYGGAIYDNDYYPLGSLALVNSTLTGNLATHQGGGLYASQSARISLFNATIAGNQAIKPFILHYPVGGGGIFITGTAVITAENTLIGNNVSSTGQGLPVPDDCVGPLISQDYNLIRTTTNCALSGTQTHNLYGQDPLLGPLPGHGPPPQPQPLLSGSPAIDAGNPSGCTDDQGQPLVADERGFPRPTFGGTALRCDIGAFELSPDFEGSSKTVNATAVRPGDLLTYTLTLSNSSPLAATFALTDTLDAHLSLVSAPGLTGNGTLTASGLLTGSTQLSYLLTVRISQNFAGTVANVAQLTGDGLARNLTAPLVNVAERLWLPLIRR